MRYTLEIQKRIYRIQENKNMLPKDKIKLLQEAAFIANDNDDIEWEYDLRMRILRQTRYINSRDLTFNTFNWLVNAATKYPDLFNEKDFLYKYKGILNIVFNNSTISRTQIDAIFNDYKIRLERNGYNLFSYYHTRMDQLVVLERFEEARECLDMCRKIGQDPMGNCDACYLDCEINFFVESGDFDEAYTLAQPLIDGQLSCAHVPLITFSSLANHAYGLGKKELAAELMEKTIPLLEECLQENDENVLTSIGRVIRYLLLTEPEKACRYMEISYPWLEDTSDLYQYGYMVNVLNGLKGEAVPATLSLELPEGTPLYSPDNCIQVEKIRNLFFAEASRLAEAFDQREGTDVFSKQLVNL